MECQKEHEELYYFETVQFEVKFLHLLIWILSFLVVTVTGGHKYFISIVKAIKHIGESTDLENADLHLSPLNKNEITVYGKF